MSTPHNAGATLVEHVKRVIVGKDETVRLAVASLLAQGHVLIEDFPGVGKTTLASALARSVNLIFRRIQFTSDLLPADIIGNSIYDSAKASFVFHEGPLFSSALLIDEVNRATPKTQSALLEAMEEGQVTADGKTYPLPKPFFVVATQNPTNQLGTFPLPESQLDRFMMRLNMGYPDRNAERAILRGQDRREILAELQPAIEVAALVVAQREVRQVHVSDPLLDYVQNLVEFTRAHHRIGLSPRAGLSLLQAARAWAFIDGRDLVVPEDIQAVGSAVMAHRLGDEHGGKASAGADLAARSLREIGVD